MSRLMPMLIVLAMGAVRGIRDVRAELRDWDANPDTLGDPSVTWPEPEPDGGQLDEGEPDEAQKKLERAKQKEKRPVERDRKAARKPTPRIRPRGNR